MEQSKIIDTLKTYHRPGRPVHSAGKCQEGPMLVEVDVPTSAAMPGKEGQDPLHPGAGICPTGPAAGVATI